MSVCRWSSDNYRCDLYIYETDAGFSVHVASNRPVGVIPEVPIPPVAASGSDWDQWFVLHRAQMDFLKNADRAPIGGPFDGASFDGLDAAEVPELLSALRLAGYRFPDHVLEEFLSPS